MSVLFNDLHKQDTSQTDSTKHQCITYFSKLVMLKGKLENN